MQNTNNVTVVIGAGSIGQAIARRVSAGKHVVLADLRQENAEGGLAIVIASRDGRSRALGQARSTGQHHQPRHHPHPAGQRRTDRPAWRRLSPNDQSQRRWALRYAG